MKLYEITQEMEVIEQMMEGEDVDQESFQLALDSLNVEYQTKVANTGLLVKNLKADADAIDAAIKDLKAKKDATNNRIDWLKSYMTENFQEKVKTPLVSVNMQKGRERLEIREGTEFDSGYYKAPELNTTLIRERLKDGEEIEGAEIVRGPDFLVIR